MNFKRKASIFILATSLLLPIGMNAIPTKLSMELWNRFTNFTIGSNDASKNYFSLERGYLGIEPTFNDNLKGRFTVDIFSTDKTHSYKDSNGNDKTGTVDGAGLKLKYAYLEAAILPLAEYLPDSKLQVGLIKTYFGTIYDWSYVAIDKDLADKEGVANSADYGVALTGFLPNGFGEYAFAAYNGEGYKKVASLVNTDMAYAANLRITPITGITVGGSYMLNSVNTDKPDGVANVARENQNLMSGVGRVVYGPVDFWANYVSKKVEYPNNSTKEDVTSSGFSLMPIISLQDLVTYPVQLVGRYESWDKNTDADDDAYDTTTFGLNYNMLPNESGDPQVAIQANYLTKSFEDSSKDDEKTIMLQLKWKFNSTISN